MNILIGLITLSICTYLGFFATKKYTERKNFYFDFFSFNKNLNNEISYLNNSIVEIVSKKNNTLFYNYIKSIFIEKKDELFINENFSKDEKVFLYSYIKSIGYSDRKTQLNFIKSVDDYLDEKYNSCIKEEEKYKKTYIKLGFLTGLILFVILL